MRGSTISWNARSVAWNGGRRGRPRSDDHRRPAPAVVWNGKQFQLIDFDEATAVLLIQAALPTQHRPPRSRTPRPTTSSTRPSSWIGGWSSPPSTGSCTTNRGRRSRRSGGFAIRASSSTSRRNGFSARRESRSSTVRQRADLLVAKLARGRRHVLPHPADQDGKRADETEDKELATAKPGLTPGSAMPMSAVTRGAREGRGSRELRVNLLPDAGGGRRRRKTRLALRLTPRTPQTTSAH